MSQKKLDRMVEKTYNFGTKTVKIKFYKEIGDELVISTDKGIIHLRAEQVKKIDELFLEVDDSPELADSVLTLKVSDQWSGLKNTIFNIIEEVKTKADPMVIERANSVNNSVKTLIDMLKLEVEVEKIMRGK